MPLPLGGNAIRRALGVEAGQRVARAIRESVSYALEHREEALNYALQFARDMDTDLADKFVGMYVNKWTLGYGERGRAAVQLLLDRGYQAGRDPRPDQSRVPERASRLSPRRTFGGPRNSLLKWLRFPANEPGERLIQHSSPFSISCRPSHFSKRNSAQPRITL